MKNPYCAVDELGFPRFDATDFIRYIPNRFQDASRRQGSESPGA